MERKRFLVCIDADGCAIDSMDGKHRLCFAPLMVETWQMEGHREEAEEIWNKVSLWSVNRGINRFRGLQMALELCGERGFLKEDLTDLAAWNARTKAYSNAALEEEIGRTGSPLLEKVLEWSISSNAAIAALPPCRVFPGVREALERMSRDGDLVVVSSANRESVETEWNRHGLIRLVREVMAQDSGTKTACIARQMEKGYDGDHVLMIGDAPGDGRAAERNGALFFPIVCGREAESWRQLLEEGFERFLNGTYRGAYAEGRMKEFLEALR